MKTLYELVDEFDETENSIQLSCIMIGTTLGNFSLVAHDAKVINERYCIPIQIDGFLSLLRGAGLWARGGNPIPYGGKAIVAGRFVKDHVSSCGISMVDYDYVEIEVPRFEPVRLLKPSLFSSAESESQ